MKSIKSNETIPPTPPSPYISSESDSDSDDQIRPVKSFSETPKNSVNYSKLDLEKCKKLTLKIEKIFIILFLTSFIIYCLVIYFIVPKY